MDEYDSTPNIKLTPPIYLMKSQLQCYMCDSATNVFCLASSGFIEIGRENSEEEDFEVKDFTHFSNIAWVPDALESVIKKHAQGYYYDYIKQRGNCYFINHCKCRTKLSEHQVHNEAETGFYPINAEQAAGVTLYEIPLTESLEICATAIVHDEDLISVNAKREKL